MSKKIAFLSVFLAFALILSYVESLIPFYFGVPGMKLGLTNLAVVLCLYLYGWKEALFIDITRVLLAGFLFGNLFMIMYSLAGALFSYTAMLVLKKTGRFSLVGVSAAGGVFHNIGQIVIAVLVTRTKGVAFYMPVLLAAGVITGMLIGITAAEVKKHIKILI